MRATISTKGQIVIPVELRAEDALKAGDDFEIKRVKAGEYLLRRLKKAPNEGLTDWLLACPVKGYFQEIPSESTDEL